jgi:hypothetical protein
MDVLCPSAWMRSVAAHKIQDHFRAVARVQHLIDQAASGVMPNKNPQPAAEVEANEQRATVRKVMDGLSEPYRLVLEWKYIDHVSVQEIAGRMATTEKAVESILFRARREFRNALGMVHRDDVPFRLNREATRLNGSALRDDESPSSVSGPGTGGPLTKIESKQRSGFDELK